MGPDSHSQQKPGLKEQEKVLLANHIASNFQKVIVDSLKDIVCDGSFSNLTSYSRCLRADYDQAAEISGAYFPPSVDLIFHQEGGEAKKLMNVVRKGMVQTAQSWLSHKTQEEREEEGRLFPDSIVSPVFMKEHDGGAFPAIRVPLDLCAYISTQEGKETFSSSTYHNMPSQGMNR